MKLLVIGIDGGDRRIIEGMPMPFLKRELTNAVHMQVEEDLWGRGWAKILSGMPSEETGAFYTKPAPIRGGCTATQSFRRADYEAAGAEPLWSRLNDAGLSVGLMNVPTTSPAPEVNGFFVSGAGAGLGARGIPNGAVYPNGDAQVLAAENYIFDTRYMASGIRDGEAFIRRLRMMTERRVRTFQTLNEKHDVELGFVAFMGLTRIQYLARSEIEKMLATHHRPWTSQQRKIAGLYEHFDAQMKALVETLAPQHVMFVSDHGHAPYKYSVDLGAFLRENGWQTGNRRTGSAFQKSVKQLAKSWLPRSALRRVRNRAPGIKAALEDTNIAFSESQAFGMRYFPGVYINDERFGGVVDAEEREKLVDEIVAKFNAHTSAMEYGMSARPYRRLYPSARQHDALPDIWIDRPDTIFFGYGVGQNSQSLGELVEPNPPYGMPLDWANITRDQWTGIKGRYPLLAVSDKNAASRIDPASGDLTDAYKLVLEICDK